MKRPNVSYGIYTEQHMLYITLHYVTLHFPCRVYTEKYNEEQLMLYITNIQTSDAGDYTCRGNAGGRTVEKSVSLTIYSK